MSIEGIPEGWELVRIGTPVFNVDWIVDPAGEPRLCDFDSTYLNRVIIRKIKLPKQYRAFENAAEFKPHRDRWIKLLIAGSDGVYSAYRVATYDDWGVIFGGSKETYGTVFNRYVFDDDGSPFGVEVTE